MKKFKLNVISKCFKDVFNILIYCFIGFIDRHFSLILEGLLLITIKFFKLQFCEFFKGVQKYKKCGFYGIKFKFLKMHMFSL